MSLICKYLVYSNYLHSSLTPTPLVRSIGIVFYFIFKIGKILERTKEKLNTHNYQ